MIKQFLSSLVLLLLFSTALSAQVPSNITLEGPLGSPSLEKGLCGEAGSITFGVLNGQSNDVSLDTIFLCFGDQLPIVHQGDFEFNDPNPATDPGIGYAFFDCIPSESSDFSGPDIATILMDPCLNHEDQFGNPQTDDIWIFTGADPGGNITLNNNGSVQAAFNGGNPNTFQTFWFAPITIDNFATQEFEQINGSGPSGPCVDVSVDQAFYVVYLSQIQVSSINTSVDASGCDGSFVLSGGLPQMDSGERYDIDISLITNSDIKGSFSGTPNHDDTVPFHVPQPGVYTVTVTDSKGCGITFNVDMAGCEFVELILPNQNVQPNTNQCIPFSVSDFTNVEGAQFSINWDPAVLEYTTFSNVHPNAPNIGVSNFNLISPGVLNFQFNNIGSPITINDNETLFEICFNVIGSLGDFTDLHIEPIPPTSIEVIGVDGTGMSISLGTIINNGVIIVSNEPLFIHIQQDSVTCPGDMDGSLTLTVSDGAAPYQYTWNTVPVDGNAPSTPATIPVAGGTAVINDLAIGQYQITITDSDNPVNIQVDTVDVLGPPSLGVAVVREAPSCVGDSDGVAWAEVNLQNVSFAWNTASTNDTITDLNAGFYEVTVTDGFGCSVIGSVTLFDPPSITVDEINSSITPAICNGIEDGIIMLAATGGTSNNNTYSFHWEDADGVTLLDQPNTASSSINMLKLGEYFITITDDNGCELAVSRTVGAAKTLSLNPLITNVSCNGLFDGQAFVTGASSPITSPPLTFAWTAGVGTEATVGQSSTLSGLAAGTVSVTMTDGTGCKVTDSFEIIEPESLIITLEDLTNETCLVGSDGSAILTIEGGTFPYTYSWPEIPGLTDSIATGLSENIYQFNVEDTNNCQSTFNVIISAPLDPSINAFNDASVSCSDSSDGQLTINAAQGSAPIDSYTWSTGDVGSDLTALSDLTPGMYIVTVTGEDFCTVIDTAFVNAPEPLIVDNVNMDSPSCPGFNNGLVTVIVSGGTPGYTYTWSTDPANPTMNPVLSGLEDDTYQVTITDANNCPSIVEDIILPDPPSIQVTLTDPSGVTCPDDQTCDGQLTASAIYSDGTAGMFNFMWPNGENNLNVINSTANLLCRNNDQTLTVSDGVCGEEITFDVASPPDINIGVEQNRPSCNGDDDGTITLTPSGGTGNFTFQWVGQAETSNILDNIVAGEYTAVLTDENDCDYTQIVDLSEPVALFLEVDLGNTTSSVSCGGDEDGVITVQYNSTDDINPVGPNPYTWSNNVAPSSSAVANDLPAGTYSITITDTKGCSDDATFVISEPIPIVFTVTPPEPPLCHGDQTQVFIESASGGTGTAPEDYVFMIDNNGLTFPITIGTPIFAGEHNIAVLDPNGCQSEQTINIDEPAELIVTLPTELIIELGDTLSRLNPIVSGGTQPYFSYQWTPGDFLSSDTILNPVINPTDNQDYEFTVIDANGCIKSASIYVELDANRNIFIPNVFSPNGDGPNDEFRIFACRGVRSIKSAQVFNRWGGMVFDATNIPPACEGGSILWDGRVNGRLAGPGVYVYLIEVEFLDGETLLYRGDIAIAR